MDEKFTVVAIEPEKKPYITEMTFQEIGKFVGGPVTTLPLYEDKLALVNDEGMMRGLPVCRNLVLQEFGNMHHTLLGNIVVIKAKAPDFVSLTKKEAEDAEFYFRSPSQTATIFL